MLDWGTMKLPAYDSLLHYGAGTLAALAGLAVANAIDVHPQVLAMGWCGIVAFWREMYNVTRAEAWTAFSPKDIAWTLLGGAVVTTASL